MHFTTTPIPQLLTVDLEPSVDERGFFARAWCSLELAQRGLTSTCVQASLSYNTRRGTLRGLHYQAAPHQEAKYVRAIRGSVHDVVLDLRENSPTRGRWYTCELTAENRRALLIPPGCAHGFLSLVDDSELLYLTSSPYVADAARGIHWETPWLHGAWPFAPTVISARDQQLPRAWPQTPGTQTPGPQKACEVPTREGILPPFAPPAYNPLNADH